MISRRTARLSLAALEAVLRRTRYNGATLPPHIKAAMEELEAVAAVSPTRQEWTPALPPTAELLSVMEAARRLGVSTRTIERRASAGTLPANRVGRSWQIIWNDERTTEMAEQRTEAEHKAPPRYRVVGQFVNVKTGAMAGVIPGRGGYTVVGIYKNDLLPADAPAEDVERLLGKGMIEAVA